MQLSKANLAAIVEDQSSAYDGLINLPEKVLQFGTGVLLRALPDYFIDKANKQGVFNGRILVVKSTQSDSSAFDRQDGLFTICASGIQNGMPVEENSINASISRVVSAQTEWNEILQAAANPPCTDHANAESAATLWRRCIISGVKRSDCCATTACTAQLVGGAASTYLYTRHHG